MGDLSPLMEAAWFDFVIWAFKQSEMRLQFETETGLDLGFRPPPKNALEAAIDVSTGANKKPSREELEKAFDAFVFWVTEYHWGLDKAPETVRAEINKRKEACLKS